VLNGKSWDDIARSLTDPSSPQARGIVGTANVFTATICAITGDAPDDVCSQPAIKTLESTITKSPPPRVGP